MSTSLLWEILKQRTARSILTTTSPPEVLSQDVVAFPFLALVGQVEMKTALLLNLINPGVGGVLLIGPRGTGKTTAVRGLVDLMPVVRRSLCPYGCDEEAVETWGMDAVCPACATKFGRGEALTGLDRMRLVELPLNAQLEDVVGGINERMAVEQQRIRLERGILANAHRNLLHIDEVNLLGDAIVDAILDAAAQGRVTVRRGPLALVYASQLILVGSMNPEEGQLRPQLQDRFGLRVVVTGLRASEERLEIYRRVRTFREHPHKLVAAFYEDTRAFAAEIANAREMLPEVEVSPDAERAALCLIDKLEIPSHRAEITTLEAARAYAAADGRRLVVPDDVAAVAPMALRQRRSEFMREYCRAAQVEDEEIRQAWRSVEEKAD